MQNPFVVPTPDTEQSRRGRTRTTVPSRRVSEAKKEESAVPLVIPTHERSEEGGICSTPLSFRRTSEARKEESAVPLVIPTHERSEEGGICCTPCHSDARAKRGRRNLLYPLAFRRMSEARKEESAVPLVIPTHERSEEGGICCTPTSPHPLAPSAPRKCLAFPPQQV